VLPRVEDVTLHPATRPMVEEYATWRALSVEMPTIDFESLRAVAMPQRRPVTPASPPGR
jgi:hypothetical protein